MKLKLILIPAFILSIFAASSQENNKELEKFFRNYSEESLKLFPFNATSIGDNRYNDLLYVDFTNSNRATLKEFYLHYQDGLKQFKRESLNKNDQISYDIFNRDMEIALTGLTFKDNLTPFSQFTGMPLTIGQFGSGTVIQPFKTVKDYENWLKRASRFSAWADSAIVYFRKGMAEGIVLPKTLVIKMIPQMEAFVTTDPTKSVFYGPITNMPASFDSVDKERLTAAYIKLINERLMPSYQKLADFLKNEYLKAARQTSGVGALPGGNKFYDYRIQLLTTTNKTPDELFNTGLSEVKRIREQMEKIKNAVGFKEDLKAFFDYMRTDPKFKPYKTPEEVLDAYRAVEKRIQPFMPRYFTHFPKTPFEIRQTEAFRAASAAAQYFAGTADGTRPGIFYVPIVDATKYTTAKTNLFLHEAIPGHHYQISLQRENASLPDFRRYGGNSAYAEGWGLYAESLGYEMGLYSDPYQNMYALGDEIHRAIRLVVDAGMHAKGWTREQAIEYMMNNEPISEQGATAEIERYMAMPAQALAYKVGELKIKELRKKYEKSLGKKFNLAAFHDELLKDGAMPLNILERKMDEWAKVFN
ncbi:MAG TPA: DUF885 domain-containing protein [Chitinophagaceae bacterium]|jgi:uncharacterized protein (DUF885 family)|nr:DUF885 domain-containing protein [Chitinophagaceae bacterium]